MSKLSQMIKKLFGKKSEIVPPEPEDSAVSSAQSTGDGKTAQKKKMTRKERKKAKKLKLKSKPLLYRIFRQIMRTIFIRVPLLVIVIIAAVLLFARLYFTAPTVEKLAKNSFAGMSYGSLDLKVEEFNPYKGFTIHNIVVRNGPDFNNEKLFEMEKLVFKYGFFRIFTGSVRFPEIGIYKPRVYLTQKNGVWNAAALMKPSEKKPEKEKEKEEEKKEEKEPATGDINLPISVDFLFSFILDDFCAYIRGDEITADLTGLTFKALIDVPPFKKIPRSVEAVRILKTMKIELNPENSMNVNFYSKAAATAPELILNWRLIFNNGGTTEFNSSMNVGAKRMPLRLKNKLLSPFNFLIAYDIFYNPITDILKINNFSFSFMNSNWLRIAGKVSSVTKNQVLDIRMVESRIPLKDLYPYYVIMTGDRRMRFNGEISLAPLSVTGTAKSPSVNGGISLKNIFFKMPGTEANIPLLSLGYFAKMYGSNMDVGADLAIPHLTYILEGSKSGDNGLKLSARASGINNFKQVKIHGVSFDFYNPEGGEKAFSLGLAGFINMAGGMSGNVNIDKIRINANPLQYMVPGRFKKQVAGIPLKKPVDISIGTNFSLGESRTAADLNLFAKIPDYNINDLRLEASVEQYPKEKRIRLNRLNLGSRNMNLLLAANGIVDLKKAPLSDSDLKVALELNNPALKSIFGPWNTSGLLKLTANMKGDLENGKAWGNLVFKDFNVQNNESMLAVNDFDMDFPFEYKFKVMKQKGSSIAITQRQVIDSDHFSDKPNFTIKAIKAKHPARNIYYEYMKDFSASMVFKDNIFRISNLKASIMDGSIYGRSILFNLADLNKDNMEFSLILDVANVNIGRLDDPDPKKGDKESELSLNANFSGRGLDINKELTASGNINIYEIGQEFANRLMKGLSQEKGKSKLGKPVQLTVDNSMIIKGFDFRLDKGLVYTDVSFIGKVLSYFVKVENDKVSFDRIPIQEYLRKVSEAK